MPAGIMSSARINIIRGFIRIIRNPFIPNPDDPVFDMTGWRIERISLVQTSNPTWSVILPKLVSSNYQNFCLNFITESYI